MWLKSEHMVKSGTKAAQIDKENSMQKKLPQ